MLAAIDRLSKKSCFVSFKRERTMPPKTKRQRQLQSALDKARESKRSRVTDEGPSASAESDEMSGRLDADTREVDLAQFVTMSEDALDTDDEAVDPSFDLDSSLKSDVEHLQDSFCDDWISHLEREDRVSLGLFLCFQLSKHFDLGDTKAAELAGMMVGRSDKTVREWRKHFVEEGEIPESKQGKYQRSGVLWSDESLNRKATQYIRDNACVKGKPNLTVSQFCQWVNDDLLPNETLEPGFPRKVSVETSRKWMIELGFNVVRKKKGTYVDGHERDDVVEYRKTFLRRMVSLGFLNESNAPTEEAKNALPSDIRAPLPEVAEKTVVLFHDESTFQSNEDQPTLWAEKGTTVMRPKSKGAGIMVSDFIDEHSGYLQLTDEEHARAKESDPTIRKHARQLFEYGEGRDGYWTSEKFMAQLKQAVKIADAKYPKADGWRVVWIFDHSSCHAAMPDDALDVNKMNVNPGGKQRVMRDGWWGGKPQSMNFSLGVPKGMRRVLEERGVDTRSMKADEMRAALGSHPDFKNEKSSIERFLIEEKGHIVYMLPKFHCELNPIERVWSQSKRYTKAYCKYSIVSLRKTIIPALETVSLENIQNYFRKVKHYMFGYLEGLPGGSDLEKLVKVYKNVIKSHRRISEHQ